MLFAVLLICAIVYVLASKSRLVRFRSEAERKAETLGQRVLGGALGFVVGLGVLLAFVNFRP